jgi:hypothetical protein
LCRFGSSVRAVVCRSPPTLAVTCSLARPTGVLSKRKSFFANALFSEAQWVRGRLNFRGGCAGPPVLRRSAHQSLKHRQSKGQHRAGPSVLRRPAHQSLKHHQSKGQHRAGLSVLRRPAHRRTSASKSSAVCAATVNASACKATLVLCPGPASTQRLRCFVLRSRPASAEYGPCRRRCR